MIRTGRRTRASIALLGCSGHAAGRWALAANLRIRRQVLWITPGPHRRQPLPVACHSWTRTQNITRCRRTLPAIHMHTQKQPQGQQGGTSGTELRAQKSGDCGSERARCSARGLLSSPPDSQSLPPPINDGSSPPASGAGSAAPPPRCWDRSPPRCGSEAAPSSRPVLPAPAIALSPHSPLLATPSGQSFPFEAAAKSDCIDDSSTCRLFVAGLPGPSGGAPSSYDGGTPVSAWIRFSSARELADNFAALHWCKIR